MPKKKYIVSLSPEERKLLEQSTTTGKSPAYKINHARILLKADINQQGGGWTDQRISEGCGQKQLVEARTQNSTVDKH